MQTKDYGVNNYVGFFVCLFLFLCFICGFFFVCLFSFALLIAAVLYAFRIFRVYDAEVHLAAQLLLVLWVAVGSAFPAAQQCFLQLLWKTFPLCIPCLARDNVRMCLHEITEGLGAWRKF